MAWSRIFDDQEVLVVVNTHGVARSGGRIRIVIDGRLSKDGMQVVANTDPLAPANMQVGAALPAESQAGWTTVGLDQWLLGPSEVMVLANQAAIASAARRS